MTSNQRQPEESAQNWRERIVGRWRLVVGPISTQYRGKDAREAAPLDVVQEFADGLDILDEFIKPEEPVIDGGYTFPPLLVVEFDPVTLEYIKPDWPGRVRFAVDRADYGKTGVFAYRGRQIGKLWGPWKALDKPLKWPDWPRIYRLLDTLHDGVNDNRYDAAEYQFRWVPFPDVDIGRAVVHHSTYKGKNCAVEVLAARFPTHAREFRAIRLLENGGFGREQLDAVSGILKRNVVLVDRLGNDILQTRDENGKWRYSPGNGQYKKEPIRIVDYDGHAVDDLPRFPETKGASVVPVPKEYLNYWESRALCGRLARYWPIPGGCIVEREAGTIVLRDQATWDEIKRRGDELGVDATTRGSVFGIECAYWRDANGFENTPSESARIWRAAQLYPSVYDNGKPAGESRDMNTAYESAPKALPDLFRKYGFPKARGVMFRGNIPAAVLEKTGMVVATLDLGKCHPWVRHCVGNEARGCFTTMRLAEWVRAGAATVSSIEAAIISGAHWPDMARPPDQLAGMRARLERARLETAKHLERARPETEETKAAEAAAAAAETKAIKAAAAKEFKYWGRSAIGRLVPSSEKNTSTYHISDPCEAASVIESLAESGALTNFRYLQQPGPRRVASKDISAEMADVLASEASEVDREGYYEISFDCGREKGSYHTHAYYLDYAGICIDRAVFAHDWEDIVRVVTDSVTLAKGKRFAGGSCPLGDAPGLWKVETKAKYRKLTASRPRPPPPEFPETAGPYWAPLVEETFVYEAPAGYGKTHLCRENLRGRAVLVVTPTHKIRKEFEAEGFKAATWQWVLRPGPKFDPEAVRVSGGTEIVYAVEVGTWSEEDIEKIFPWLVGKGYRVIADGDRHQQEPIKGRAPWNWLDANAVIDGHTLARDYRSLEPEFAALKESIRGKSNADAFRLLEEAVCGYSYRELLAEWHPRDYVYATTHAMREKIIADLEAVRREKYPNEPRRIYYGSKSSRSGETEHQPPGAAIPQGARDETVSTYRICQGDTLGTAEDPAELLPRAWLINHRLGGWAKNAVYTAATRPRRKSQLRVVADPPPLCHDF